MIMLQLVAGLGHTDATGVSQTSFGSEGGGLCCTNQPHDAVKMITGCCAMLVPHAPLELFTIGAVHLACELCGGAPVKPRADTYTYVC